MASAQKLLWEGVSDAACFMLGALAGYSLGQWMGFDIFADGYSGWSLLGIALVGLGGGGGLHVARALRLRQQAKLRALHHPTD